MSSPSLAEMREDARFRVLRLLEDQPDLSQRQIAEELGISLGSVNYCLKGLVDRGLVKIRNFRSSRNKMGYAYLLTPRGVAEKSALTGAFLARRMREYEALKAEIAAVEEQMGEAGEDWAR
ncbi:MarR family EPS-associated transcriptional regulator [Ovoidimarina sediminis]|uniref:MarR family EPS-associated transcriptional regulator n=1 Tax=Ovoidimarina sediminis TaxID=3079856 RepID=UPI00290A4805|nr:MarR family EPS-associated transcriptional regulator [Rhodophyticola sp. MJ-SS7]MDU8946165.1 MarR family EPS-associated transcriptional regulator [Rhodophyticola sp. MJ-SS7]